jgi:alkylhydroperoxidase/carboxymuconolactone decarboxylase family protein YurZ
MAPSTDETPLLDLLKDMTASSLDATNLDEQTLMLVRIAALVAVDAPPVSYAMNIEAAGEVGVDAEQVRGVLAAIAPIVGTTRVVSATTSIAGALALEIELAELEDQGQQ